MKIIESSIIKIFTSYAHKKCINIHFSYVLNYTYTDTYTHAYL